MEKIDMEPTQKGTFLMTHLVYIEKKEKEELPCTIKKHEKVNHFSNNKKSNKQLNH